MEMLKTPIITPKIVPHNTEIEKSILGAILRNNDVLERAENLVSEHFYEPEHQKIFSIIIQTIEKGMVATPATLAHIADGDQSLQTVQPSKGKSSSYLAKLASDVISIINIRDHARILQDLFLKRQLIAAGEDLVNESYESHMTGLDQIEKTEGVLYGLAVSGHGENRCFSLKQATLQALASSERALASERHITGITTGFQDIDDRLGGLQKSDLLILAGRPAMGKTSLATNIAFNAASNYDIEHRDSTIGATTLFFSLEMSAEQLAGRILAEQSKISSDKIRRGDITKENFSRIAQAASDLHNIPLYIDDTPDISIDAIRQRARRASRKFNIGLIVVDYLQLIKPRAHRGDRNRVGEVSEITRGLKIIAKELNIPVLALSQLSRLVEGRDDKRPQLSDLRESGSIEQDADVVMFVYRPEYYLQNAKPEQRSNESSDNFLKRSKEYNLAMEKHRNVAQVIVAKQRNGPIGVIDLFFEGEYTKFSNLRKSDDAS